MPQARGPTKRPPIRGRQRFPPRATKQSESCLARSVTTSAIRMTLHALLIGAGTNCLCAGRDVTPAASRRNELTGPLGFQVANAIGSIDSEQQVLTFFAGSAPMKCGRGDATTSDYGYANVIGRIEASRIAPGSYPLTSLG